MGVVDFELVELNTDDLAIDVSSHNDEIDWEAIQNSVKGVYIRATMGAGGVDTQLIQNAQSVTIPHGFYHLFRGEYSGIAQAEHFLKTIAPYRYQLPLAIDVEEIEPPHPLTPVQMAERIYDLCLKLEFAIGVKSVIYTRASFWNSYVASQHDDYFSRCRWWVAHYGVEVPTLPRACPTQWLHQYSSQGQINGIIGRVDLNHVKKPELRLRWPTNVNNITQRFGANPAVYQKFKCDGIPLWGHEGVDLSASLGSPIYACADGLVSRVEPSAVNGGNYGIHVRIKHFIDIEEYETIYGHFQKIVDGLKVGDSVRRGKIIGYADSTGNSTGNHLHLSLKQKGATQRGFKQKISTGEWVVFPCDLISPEPFLDSFGIF